MILRPGNEKQIIEQLKKIPGNKRKTVIFIDRHLNEGGYPIAKMHHKEWEKYGAVVVRIPVQWTPHGLWLNQIKLEKVAPPSNEIPSTNEKIMLDWELSRYLASEKISANIIHFHGSSAKKRELKFYNNGYNYIHPEVMGINQFESFPGNTIVAEFGYLGKAKHNTLYEKAIKTRLSKADSHLGGLKDHNYYYQLWQGGEGYLANRIASREDISSFSTEFSPKFNELLKFLSEKPKGY